ncbi:tuftelin 1b isoform X1 [Hemibagrus wyckioides]|uniref:tuftelin 1b isoform X1 n=1 Tax=Hemibagrus wyckioides TaxID=337641 RepID=UPI00266CE012|nr:tuftelin 1b isoform X1 [Hemibagrus wyckioides]
MEASHRAEQETHICELTLHDYNQNLVTETLHDNNNQNICVQPAVLCEAQIRADSSTLLGEQIEVIKVYLERGRQEQNKEQQSLTMLTDEVSHIQEVRYCLKTLREQMAARHNNNNKSPVNGIRVHISSSKFPDSNTSMNTSVPESQEQECVRLREMTKHLSAQLQEAERRHQEDREALQEENTEILRRLEEQNHLLQQVQDQAEEQSHRTEELQKLLENLKLENNSLHDKITAGEAELQELQALKDGEDVKRCKQLEKEQEVLKEKIHHLDDMLKSQQRKVRHMIEQLQNSRVMMEERERLIGDLEEKVAFLEAENREMRDQMEFCLGDEAQSSHQSEAKIVYSKPLTPTSPGNKSLPFIKVIEIKT